MKIVKEWKMKRMERGKRGSKMGKNGRWEKDGSGERVNLRGQRGK